jgi:hypothetical protein
MRFRWTHTALPLAVLLALPALSPGGRVAAGYVACVTLKPSHTAGPFEMTLPGHGLDQDLAVHLGPAAQGTQSEPPPDRDEDPDPRTLAEMKARLAALLSDLDEPSSAGTGAGPATGGPSAQVGLAEPPEIPLGELIARFFAREQVFHFPPMVTGLFRPPRQGA